MGRKLSLQTSTYPLRSLACLSWRMRPERSARSKTHKKDKKLLQLHPYQRGMFTRHVAASKRAFGLTAICSSCASGFTSC
ncbi:hypothetical protein QL285_056719 [Trifolium repens]|nr:hypothetical protein QL285_056719 [Trifolium repens]